MSRSDTTPSQDPIGAYLVRQRAGLAVHADQGAGQELTDLGEIARILAGCMAMEEGEDDLVFELLMLESMLGATPVKSDELLEQLGALGEEVRDGLLPPGMINVAALRQRTRRLRQHLGGLATRVSAAMLVFLTGLPLFGQEARAAEEDAKGYAVASSPVVRVIDANTSQPMPGVQIKTMEERLLGVTDATGQATLAEGYMETDLLSLEKDGYEMYLLDRTQLSSRNIVTMKPLKGAVAAAPAPGARGAAATGAAPAVKPPTPPKGPEAPRVTHEHGQPHVVAPKPPSKPSAPTIRLPVRPRAKAADLHARAGTPTAKPAHEEATPHTAPGEAPHAAAHAPAKPHAEMKLPVKPKLHAAAKPATTAHAPADHAPTTHAPAAHKPAAHAPAAHAPAAHKPAAHAPAAHAPTAHKPAAHAPAAHAPVAHAPHGHAPKPASAPKAHVAAPHAPAHAAAAPTAAHERTMSMPARPRKPQMADSGGSEMGREMPTVAVPRRMPRPRMDEGMGAASYYRVRPGDSLSLIAKRTLGSAKRWPEIYRANRDRVANPALIRVGQQLALPGGEAPQMAGGTTYVVKPGDCLFTIASSQLGSGLKWRSLWQVNKDKIRDARFIFPGQVLTLPNA